MISRQDVYRWIDQERERQDELHPMSPIKDTGNTDANVLHNYIVTNDFMAILVEEVGEVARALQGDGVLIEEIVHVAATCVRWLENLK